MKYILKLTLGLLLGAGILIACSDDSDNKSIDFSLNKEDITVGNNGGTEQLAVTVDGKWSASVDASWIKVTPANGLGSGECTIEVDSTVISDLRQATIRFVAEGQTPKKVTVYQTGYEKGIYIQQQDTTIESSGKLEDRVLKMKVITNVKFEKIDLLNVVDAQKITWLEYKEKDFDLDYGDRPRTIQLQFKWSNNPEEKVRAAKVVFIPTDKTVKEAVLIVNQKAAPVITDDRAGDSLALLAIPQMINVLFELWNPSENMQYWKGVILWEKTDKEVIENPKMLGRVRCVAFKYAETKESIPYQVSKLTYVEDLSFFSNVNNGYKNITLDATPLLNLKHLKRLMISSYGLLKVDEETFKQLGDRLVSLDFTGNHFNRLPECLTPIQFPKLTTLKLGTQRRWDTIKDLKNDDRKDNIGLHIKTTDENFMRLITWNALDTLSLQYGFVEGELPVYVGVDSYTPAEIKEKKLSNKLAWQSKVLPNTRFFTLNLNFLTGQLPDWLLYHPHLSDWDPLLLFFEQEIGFDSNGLKTGFTNKPIDLEYYYKEYPDKRPNFEIE